MSKSDGIFLVCTDYIKVNSVTKTDSFPVRRVDNCIDTIGHAKYVTKIDRLKGSDKFYLQTELGRFLLMYEGISKSFEPNMERARNLDLFCFIFQRSPLPTPHTCPI